MTRNKVNKVINNIKR